MAVFNEILVGRFNRGLQKLFGVKGIVPVRALAPEIMPVHVIFQGVETRFLDGWSRFANSFRIPQNAAQTAGFRIRNPQNSNTIAILESIMLGATFTEFVREDQLPGTLGDLTTNPSVTFDTRLSNSPVCICSQSNVSPPTSLLVALIGVQPFTLYQLINDENQEQTLLPGFALQWSNQTVNQDLDVSLIWRERFLEESERGNLPQASII
jgi:hypothetical protein